MGLLLLDIGRRISVGEDAGLIRIEVWRHGDIAGALQWRRVSAFLWWSERDPLRRYLAFLVWPVPRQCVDLPVCLVVPDAVGGSRCGQALVPVLLLAHEVIEDLVEVPENAGIGALMDSAL